MKGNRLEFLEPFVGAIMLVGSILGIAFAVAGSIVVDELAKHALLWLRIALALIAVVSLALAGLAAKYDHDANVLAGERDQLMEELSQLRLAVTGNEIQRKLDEIASTLATIGARRSRWFWRR